MAKRLRPTRRMIKALVRWQGLVADHRASGKDLAQFCRERGVNRIMFYKWRKRLERKDLECAVATKALPAPAGSPAAPERPEAAISAGAVPVVRPSDTPGRFVPVRLTGPVAPSGGWAMEVQFPAGHVLKVGREVDPETIVRVLATMRVVAC
jgi:hypothetical protein